MKAREAEPSVRLGVAIIAAIAAALLVTTSAAAQSATDVAERNRPATTTTTGDTGLWSVPTGSVLPAKHWTISFSRSEGNMGQGFFNTSNFPLSFGVGVGGRAELFASFRVITRLDRDTSPLFFDAPAGNGTGGGIDVDYPLERSSWSGSKRGDLWLGGKVNLLPADRPVAFGIRPMIKVPTADKTAGAGTGKTDIITDFVVSGEASRAVTLSGYGGFIIRGNPDGYSLTNGVRWGFGAGIPSRSRVQFTAELYGEQYLNDTITAPAGQFGTDGSPVPTSTIVKSPIYLNLGVTVNFPRGFFIGLGGNWNMTMPSREDAGPQYDGHFFKAADVQVRLGFRPGATRPAPVPAAGPSPAAPPAAPPAAAPTTPPTTPPVAAPTQPPVAPRPAPPVNNAPTVRANCDPCRVEVGKTSTVSADAQDPDGDTLTYAWRAATGVLAAPAERRSVWTAPMAPGAVPVTVTVSDGKGGTATDTVTIDVTTAAARKYEFSDIYFDFDRHSLLPAAMSELDKVVAALANDPTVKLTIEGYTCDIGTVEYNLALSERRANTVRDYLIKRGIARDRLTVVSYGEERPKYDNSREATRMLNRRAALTIRVDR